MPLYPLLLEPIYLEKVWGGRALERLGRSLPGGSETRIGESWELADLEATSPSGAGGGAARSRIRNGPLAKRTLHEVVDEFGELVMGTVARTPQGAFPLLLKYLDAAENLSIQVHPSPEYATAHPDAHLKSEAWYVIEAEPGAVIYKGIVEGTTPEGFAAAMEAGAVRDVMVEIPVQAGDCHFLPSGTCHALGAGILVAEVQTPSDTTFRVYDWGRTDRELHLEQALESIDFGPAPAGFEPGTSTARGGAVERHLVRCPDFALDEIRSESGCREPLSGGQPVALMVIRGRAAIRWGGAADRTLPLGAGSTVLLPAALDNASLESSGPTSLLRISFPTPDPPGG